MENRFKKTEIGDIPEDWRLVKIEDIFDLQHGKSLSSKRKSKGELYPFLRTSNTLWGRVDLSKFDYMNFTDEEIAKLRLQPGDLLVCEGGEIGRTAMWRGEIEVCGHQNHVHRLRSREQEVWSEFYMYWMQAAFLLFGLYAGQGIKTTIPNLSGGRLKSFPVPKPSFTEQQKIAKVLSTIQQAIEQQDKIIASVRELKRSLMRKLFTEGLGDAELKETEIGTMPKHWDVVRLGEVVDIIYGVRAAVAHLQDESIGTPILTNINITNDGVLDFSTLRYYELPEKKREKLILKKGDLLFNWRSGSKRHVGKTALFDFDGEYTFSSFILRFRTTERVNNVFLLYYLHSIREQGFFAQMRQQSSVNSVFNASVTAKIPIPVPTLPEQQEIARILSTVVQKIEVEENRKGFLQELFKTMLHKLMTGQIRVKNLDLEVCSESTQRKA